MYSGVSGLRSHQTMMDVIGNNIANVNTTGFKSSSVTFQDTLSQLLRGAGAPADALGGTNPAQVGLGTQVAGITTNMAQGASQLTGRATDLAIQGDGMFIARMGQENLYTRQGSLSFDTSGRLVTPEGAMIQGWMADAAGNVNTNAVLSDLQMPLAQLLQPQQTQSALIGGNLPASAEIGDEITSSIKVYDAQGTEISLGLTFTKTADDAWDVAATADGAAVTLSRTSLTFDPTTGEPVDGTPLSVTFPPGSGQWPDPVEISLGDADTGLRQFSGSNSMSFSEQNGAGVGFLRSFSISSDGVLTGVFSNGKTRPVGQIAMANFNNPQGLEKAGNSMYRVTINSGLPQIGAAGEGGRGSMSGGTLEMSNVDLAQEFTNLIVAQRGFQANSRIITASDELLQDLVNLKR
jgi:flagellar hook protein FlgE